MRSATRPGPRHAARLLAGAIGVLAAAGVLAPAAVAGAEVSGPCRISVDGVDVDGVDSSDPDTAVVVGPDDRFAMTFEAETGLRSYAIDIDYAGISWSVARGTDRGKADTTRTRYVSVADYRRYGVGLYRVSGRATLTDGRECEGAGLVRVAGSPLATAAGIGSGLVLVGGLAAVGAATVRARRGARQIIEGVRR